MTSYPSNYDKEYSPEGSHSLFQFERSDVISVPHNSTEYSFAFFNPKQAGGGILPPPGFS